VQKNLLRLSLLFSLWLLCGCSQEAVEPEPEYRKDVKPVMIIDEYFTLGSALSLSGKDRWVAKNIKLPAGTVYWTYWIGVGQEPVEKLQESLQYVSKRGQQLCGGNPFIAFGLGILPSLPIWPGTVDVDFYFVDQLNYNAFANGQEAFIMPNSPLGKQTINSWRMVDVTDCPGNTSTPMYMIFYNKSGVFSGRDIRLQVYAYVLK